MSNKNKNERIYLRGTEEDKRIITYNADLMGISVNEYILLCVRRKRIVVCENFPDMIYEMSRIGNNINQIAAVANTNNYISEKSIAEVKKLLMECRGEMNKFISFIIEPEQEFKNEGDIRLTDIVREMNNSLKSMNLKISHLEKPEQNLTSKDIVWFYDIIGEISDSIKSMDLRLSRIEKSE